MNRDVNKLHELRESEGTCYLALSWELDGVCKIVGPARDWRGKGFELVYLGSRCGLLGCTVAEFVLKPHRLV